MAQAQKPLLVFDGDCNFCRRWVGRWRLLTGDRVEYAPSQQAAKRLPGVSRAEFAAAVWLLEGGRKSSGAEAVFRVLSYAPGRGLWLRAYQGLPGFAAASEAAYRAVARHRVLFSKLTRLLWGDFLEPPAYRLAVE